MNILKMVSMKNGLFHNTLYAVTHGDPIKDLSALPGEVAMVKRMVEVEVQAA